MSIADRQVSSFETGLRNVVSNMQSLILLSAESGKLFSKNADARIRYAPEFLNGIISAINQSGYYDLVQDLILQDKDLIAEVTANRSSAGLPSGFTDQSVETIRAFQNMEFAQFRAIGDQFVQSLHIELMNFTLSGTDEAAFVQAIRSSLESKFQRYAVTYANTSRAQFTQRVEDEAAKSYDGKLYWQYVGPGDGRTRTVCLDGLAQKYFTDAERTAFESANAIARAWNCRHRFMQITEQDYKEATK